LSKKRTVFDFLPGVRRPKVPSFGTGEVAEILNVPIWRLQKFLDSPRYQLKPDGRLGQGRGSRRTFSTEDIYRIAITARMAADGFTATFVGSMLEQIEDYDFHPGHDSEGNEISAQIGLIGLRRDAQGTPEPKFYNKAPMLGEKDSPYYLLDASEIIAGVDKRIAEQLRARLQR
jgi:hypothetical protein